MDGKFKHDPLYDSIIQYFENLSKSKKTNKTIDAPELLEFQEKYVDNFCDLKNLYIMKVEINDYLKLMDSQYKTLEKMEILKEKYKYIKKEIERCLNCNHEYYYQYYEEWRKVMNLLL